MIRDYRPRRDAIVFDYCDPKTVFGSLWAVIPVIRRRCRRWNIVA